MAAIETDHFPSITSDPDVQGGAAVVRGTRLPVRAVAFYWRETGDKSRILRNYPQLTPEALDEAIRYYEAHRTEIDEELRVEAEGRVTWPVAGMLIACSAQAVGSRRSYVS